MRCLGTPLEQLMARQIEPQPPPETDWEDKYRTLLRDATLAEDQWREIEEILKRGVSRLSLLIQEGDPGLDAQLESLRANIREGGDLRELSERLDSLSGLASRPIPRSVPEVDGTASQAALVANTRSLICLLDRLKHYDLLPADSHHKFKRAVGAIRSAESQKVIMDDLAKAIHGFVCRHTELKVAEPAIEKNDGHDVNKVLLEVLETLPVPHALSEDTLKIKQALQSGLSEDDFPNTLKEFLSLSVNTRRIVREQAAEIHKFLLGITDKLKDIEQHVALYAKRNTEAADNTRSMGDSVRSNLKNIQYSLDSEIDISLLKRSVQSHLETIEVSIATGISKQEEASSKTQSEITRLLNRMDELENEASKLRVQVTQERARALLDPLTKLHNRAALDQQLEQEVNRCARYGVPFSLIVWDLDHFKKVNDAYGHQAGDKVLKVVSTLLGKRQRNTDFTARYGGEEFVCLLPETDLAGAQHLAEDIRKCIADSDFRYRGNTVQITVSAGITSFQPQDTAEAMLSRADAALYRAKENGRNQVKTSAD